MSLSACSKWMSRLTHVFETQKLRWYPNLPDIRPPLPVHLHDGKQMIDACISLKLCSFYFRERLLSSYRLTFFFRICRAHILFGSEHVVDWFFWQRMHACDRACICVCVYVCAVASISRHDYQHSKERKSKMVLVSFMLMPALTHNNIHEHMVVTIWLIATSTFVFIWIYSK